MGEEILPYISREELTKMHFLPFLQCLLEIICKVFLRLKISLQLESELPPLLYWLIQFALTILLKPERDFNSLPNKPGFLRVCNTSPFENSVGKGEILHNEQFLLFSHSFLAIWRTFASFPSILKLSSAKSFRLEESKICRLRVKTIIAFETCKDQ